MVRELAAIFEDGKAEFPQENDLRMADCHWIFRLCWFNEISRIIVKG